jgi:hypothetical protein
VNLAALDENIIPPHAPGNVRIIIVKLKRGVKNGGVSRIFF